MSTTHSTSETLIEYTIAGGQNRIARDNENGISLVLLKRRSRVFRPDMFSQWYKSGFESIISIEDQYPSFDIETLADSYPELRFLIFRSKRVSIGEKINIAIKESHSSWVFVLWDDISLEPLTPLAKHWLVGVEPEDTVCVVPRVINGGGDDIPFLSSPMKEKRKFRIITTKSEDHQGVSLFPFDYCGIYNKKLFQMYGGYDADLKQSYWQKADLGMRILLWGGVIRYNSRLVIRYDSTNAPEDTTANGDYLSFYLKNLALEMKKGEAFIRRSQIVRIGLTSRMSLPGLLRRFRTARLWIRKHRLRFKNDPDTAIRLWGVR